jgi:DNA-binding CsgD family transcriptional regulator/sugar-specific transcriptional regulator TrmB
MLRAVGVEEFDEQVYRALLRRPGATADDLGSIVDSTTEPVVAALSRLAGLGLIRATGSGGYTPNDPEPALAALVHRREAELQAVRSTSVELAADFQIGRLRANPERLVEVVTGAGDIYRRTMELYEGASSEILAFERPPYAVPADFDETATERPLLDRGVTLRVVYSAEALAAPGKFDTVRALAEHGELARTLPALPLKLMIVDRRAARVSLTTDTYATESVAIIQSSGLLDALIALFEAYWERAHPIGGGAVAAELSGEEARVLELLSAGFKDEAIARNLRTSMRTVGRRVERILARLDATTRFQAGAQAVRRDWL